MRWQFVFWVALFPSAARADEDEIAVRFEAGFGDGVAIETRDGSFGMGLRARTQARLSVVDVLPAAGSAAVGARRQPPAAR